MNKITSMVRISNRHFHRPYPYQVDCPVRYDKTRSVKALKFNHIGMSHLAVHESRSTSKKETKEVSTALAPQHECRIFPMTERLINLVNIKSARINPPVTSNLTINQQESFYGHDNYNRWTGQASLRQIEVECLYFCKRSYNETLKVYAYRHTELESPIPFLNLLFQDCKISTPHFTFTNDEIFQENVLLA